jgi:hypothetical protein
MMPIWSQHLLVLLAVIVCGAFIIRQAIAALSGRRSRLSGCGSCKTCAPSEPSDSPQPGRVHIIPIDMLKKR